VDDTTDHHDVDEGPVERLSAVTLAVRDMGRAVGFYEALGFRRLYGGPGAAFTSYGIGGGFLNLQLVEDDPDDPDGPRAGWGRVVLWVDDVDAMFDRVRAAGFAPALVTEPADATWGERYFHVRDPDGHELSFARPLDPGGS
jgi:catechol 2,3-dioxygenase-like lactoylglutathione lyase family enzyme